MSSSLRVAVLTLTVAAGLIAAGCGGGASSLSLTGPSVVTGISSGAASALSDSSTFGAEKKGGEHGPDNSAGRPDSDHGRPDGRGVQVNGRITALDAAARTLNVGAAKVNVPLTVVIRHGNRTFLFTDLALGDHVQVKGSRNEAGVVVAAEVKVEQGGKDEDDDEDEDDDLNRAELDGAVSALTGTCPALTFSILTTKVTTTATTTFRGITCAAIANGTVVEVEGTKLADGSIAAMRVSRED